MFDDEDFESIDNKSGRQQKNSSVLKDAINQNKIKELESKNEDLYEKNRIMLEEKTNLEIENSRLRIDNQNLKEELKKISQRNQTEEDKAPDDLKATKELIEHERLRRWMFLSTCGVIMLIVIALYVAMISFIKHDRHGYSWHVLVAFCIPATTLALFVIKMLSDKKEDERNSVLPNSSTIIELLKEIKNLMKSD